MFLKKCIGQDNYKLYVLSIFTAWLTLTLYVWLEWSIYDQMIDDSSFTPIYYIKTIGNLLNSELHRILALALVVFVHYYLSFSLAFALWSISGNATGNEVLNRHKYFYLYEPFEIYDGSLRYRFVNPFDKGFIKNWVHFIIR
jgi:hypothetical protein